MFSRNYGLLKTWLDKWLKNPVSEHCLPVNTLESLIYFFTALYHIFSSFLEKWSSKKSLIVISEILGLIVNSW